VATDLEGEQGLLDDESTALADRVDRVSGDQWTLTGSVVGGGELSALDVAKEAVRVAVDGLHATEAAMHYARTH
jgi:hypothetical protein